MNSTGPPPETSTMAPPWVPLWQGIERIASAIGDSREPEHYAKTRLYIRQAALDGRLRIRGRHEIEIAGQDRTNFSEFDLPIGRTQSSMFWQPELPAKPNATPIRKQYMPGGQRDFMRLIVMPDYSSTRRTFRS